MMFSRFLLLFLMVFGVAAYPLSDVFAQDEASEEAAEDGEADPDIGAIRAEVYELTSELGDAERTHFYAIYDAHNLLNVVKTVQGSVEEATEKCIENNPDMKADLSARYEAWDDVIDEAVDDVEANENNMIAAQDYMEPSKIKGLLKTLDKTRKKKDEEIKKIPVTSPEACEYLLNKMDETEDNLTGLLRTTLISLPQALQNAQSGEEQEGEAEAPEEAAEE